MSYLWWYDDSPKATINAKIIDAMEAYRERFGVYPTVALVNADEGMSDGAPLRSVAGLTVRSESYIRRNNVFVGVE